MIGATAAPFFFPKKSAIGRRRLPLLLLLAAPPVASFLWGQALASTSGCTHRPAWISGVLLAPVILSLVLPVGLLPFLRGGRGFTITVGLFAAGLTLGVSFLATMQVTGCWL